MFPAIDVARRAGKAGGSLTAVFNAANEVAAQAFSTELLLRFPQIVETVAHVIDDADQWRAAPGSVTRYSPLIGGPDRAARLVSARADGV